MTNHELTALLYKAAGDFVEKSEGFTKWSKATQAPAIREDAVEPLTSHLQLFIAHVIAGLINAGSERDVVMEDERLHDAIANAIKEWT